MYSLFRRNLEQIKGGRFLRKMFQQFENNLPIKIGRKVYFRDKDTGKLCFFKIPRSQKKKKPKEYLFALWYDNSEKIELTVVRWELTSGFLIMDLGHELRAMQLDRVLEFVVKDKEED